MAELAGFDVIGQVHVETVVDLVNLVPILNPGDGSSFYLLGGPVSLALPVPLGSLGSPIVRVIASAHLVPVVHQPLVTLLVDLSGGSIVVAGRAIDNIGGSVTVDVPLTFSVQPAGAGTPVAVLDGQSPKCRLDDMTRAAADQVLGAGGADLLERGIEIALGVLLAAAGSVSIPVMAFHVDPGVDSHDPRRLSAPPEVAWIDASTLGVFGYYRAGASGGRVDAKTVGDLAQPREEFFYGLSGAVSVLPGRRAAILISTQAAHSVLVCPAIHDYVVTGLLQRSEQLRFRVLVRDRDGATVSAEQNAAHLAQYESEEYQRGGFDNPTEAIARAQARVQQDVVAVLNRRADGEEAAWLVSAEGKVAIDAAVPPPCGTGTAPLLRQPMKLAIAQSDLVATLLFLDVIADSGRFTIHAVADAALELSTGDVSATATIDVGVVLSVTDLGLVQVSVTPGTPTLALSGTGLDGEILGLLESPLYAGPTSAVISYLALVLQEQLVSGLAGSLSPYGAHRFGGDVSGVAPIPMPEGTRMADLVVEPDSILTVGLICRHPVWNLWAPGLAVDVSGATSPAQQPSIEGTFLVPATKYCPGGQFGTTRTFWDTTLTAGMRVRDLPFPITVLNWQIEIGNFSVSSHFIDPRPTWSNEPALLTAGTLTLTGKVNHPDPPLVAIVGPAAIGHMYPRDDLQVVVEGAPDRGWQIHCHGVDGNFYVRLAVDAQDGDHVQWHGETFIHVQGDALSIVAEYSQYVTDCAARTPPWWELKGQYAELATVAPGQPASQQTRDATVIRTQIAAGDVGALSNLIDATERFGSSVVTRAGKLAPLPRVDGTPRSTVR